MHRKVRTQSHGARVGALPATLAKLPKMEDPARIHTTRPPACLLERTHSSAGHAQPIRHPVRASHPRLLTATHGGTSFVLSLLCAQPAPDHLRYPLQQIPARTSQLIRGRATMLGAMDCRTHADGSRRSWWQCALPAEDYTAARSQGYWGLYPMIERFKNEGWQAWGFIEPGE
jgi:hypothetical protein